MSNQANNHQKRQYLKEKLLSYGLLEKVDPLLSKREQREMDLYLQRLILDYYLCYGVEISVLYHLSREVDYCQDSEINGIVVSQFGISLSILYELNNQNSRLTLDKIIGLFPSLPNIWKYNHCGYSTALETTSKAVNKKLYGWLKHRKYNARLILEIQESQFRSHFVNWVNSILLLDIYDVYRSTRQPLKVIQSLDQPIITENQDSSFSDVPDNDNSPEFLLEKAETLEQSLIVQRFIERDENFSKKTTRDIPECNLRTLALLIAKKKENSQSNFTALARKYGISDKNLHALWRRHGKPKLEEVRDNYHQYRYLLNPLPLSEWLNDKLDSAWLSFESLLQNEDVPLVYATRKAVNHSPEIRWKEINLGMANDGQSLALVVGITPDNEQDFIITIRVYPMKEQLHLPSNLELIIYDENKEVFSEVKSGDNDNWIQLKLSGQVSETFSIEISLGCAKFREDFII
ncbi:DUF1822 family protein [Planktothrix mougeotii]|uniref:DUF1822 family protein n=1 Tax=Planktothrix mougeotii LEGE 06226 TaxID=1828728 RepID=A0ABR9UJP1_9CYAN|nr:DUF1822 family protein [Planktothrix mougeotii]MBE9146672.1 DUF1822 family protein [Planktothrix mougeotii LEGE 06226]